jgi:CheY-like chemotaxis protein
MKTGVTGGFKDRTTILLAEDNFDDIVLIRCAFEQAGVPYQLEVVQNGEQAIHYLNGEGAYSDRTRYPMPFLLLLDLKMPIKSGFEVLDWIRHEARLDQLLVVILSGSNLSADVWKADQLGTNSYLVKSGDHKQLMFFLQSLNPTEDTTK